MLIRFNEKDVRSMGRNAAGVKAITLGDEDQVVGMEIVEEDSNVLNRNEKWLWKTYTN